MQKVQLQQTNQSQEEEWQIYQPKDQNKSIFKVFNGELKNLMKLVIALSLVYLVFALMSPLTIIVACTLVGASVKLIKIKTAQIRKQGLANKISPKLRQLLFQKSIFDIYSDILYFPLITKIIGAFVKPILAKPHPHELSHSFQDLPQNIQNAISRKGLLSLIPNKVQNIVVNQQKRQLLPQNFGKPVWEWYNYQKYQNHHQKVHEHTISKKIVERIDDKISWAGFALMASIVGFGVFKMKPIRMKKMLIQNGSFFGILLVTLIALIKIKKIKDQIKKQKQDCTQMQRIRNILLQKDE